MCQRVPKPSLMNGVSSWAALALGAALRLWFLHIRGPVGGDALGYGDIARNLVVHGVYGFTDGSGIVRSTLVRLPGYPFFVAVCFRVFGVGNYTSVVLLQISLELCGCVLLADLARRMVIAANSTSKLADGAAHSTLWLGALCPFTAIYAATPVSEALTLFFIALVLWSAQRFGEEPSGRRGWAMAMIFTLAVTGAALLRPDGALIGLAFAGALCVRRVRLHLGLARLARLAAVCVGLAVLPFVLWTARNERVFHVIQPLAPRYAIDPGIALAPGSERWFRTWTLDFVSTYEVYWAFPGDAIDIAKLPSRAFDSPVQYARTAETIADYNRELDYTPAIDAAFGRIADERIEAHPWRYYLWLPLGRIADMTLRPRTENLPVEPDWWNYGAHPGETLFAWSYAALNLAYFALSLAGLCLRPRLWQFMLLYLALRSALLGTLEGPEARYTLEFFPILFVTGGIALERILARRSAHVKPTFDDPILEAEAQSPA
jgi:hypothetical protein